MERSELEALYGLYLSEGIGNLRAIALCEHFGSPERAYRAGRADLLAVSGFGEQTVSQFMQNREAVRKRSKADLAGLPSDAKAITYFDEEYPVVLKSIYSPPLILFVQGNAGMLHRDRNIAIVGTRRMTTDYGQPATRSIAADLATAGVCITSGFALGVDTCAHRSAFDAGGETIAVLGSGINVIYPAANKKFAKEMIESGRGVIISEFPVDTPPDAKNFPWRNRIVCGLARACIVIESDEKGGSMLTAEIARDQGRVLYAVPGDIFRTTSKGPNMLLALRQAYPVRTAADVLRDMGWTTNNQVSVEKSMDYAKKATLSLTESAIVEVLEVAGASLHIDILAERSKIAVSDLLVHLLDLEFRDIVRQLPGKYFSAIF